MSERRQSPRSCFVMMPFRDKYRKTFDRGIRPAVEAYGFECVVSDVTGIGPIPDRIRKEIQEAIVCVAEVSEGNPNVMYEVGMAQALGKPVVFAARDPRKVPFDVSHMQIIAYSDDEPGLKQLGARLHSAFRHAAKLEQVSRMLMPSNLGHTDGMFVIAASPLSWRVGRRREGGFEFLTETFSDSVGIRSLILEFGFMRKRDRQPELLNPEDYVDDVVRKPMHLYSIGSPKANHWTELALREFAARWRPAFNFVPRGDNVRDISLKLQRDGKDFMPLEPSFERDFGLIIRGPNPFNNQYLLTILAGCRSTGTEAACRAATNAALLARIATKTRVNLDAFEEPFYALVSLKRHGETRGYAADPDSLELLTAGVFTPRAAT